ncbi:MAG: hypothetical protein FJ104_04170 [Deltaproteobacteria bacterium]|nr:hypothetical protein [Deltaproteobacteria bacterium]
MNIRATLSSVTLLAALAVSPSALALTVDLGSDGSDGALNVTSNTTLPLPPDGIFHFTTVNIAAGATLKFSHPGPLHPGVVILATGDVTINGTIDLKGGAPTQGVAGTAGPGGSPGAQASYSAGHTALNVSGVSDSSSSEQAGGPGLRPSGGTGGRSASRGGSPGTTTGCSTPGAGGGGGGGALVLFSNTRIAGTGRVDTSGGAGASVFPTGPSNCDAPGQPAEAGWDGSVRLGAPRVDFGSGTVVARVFRVDAVQQVGAPTLSRGPRGTSTQTTRPPFTGSLLQRFPASLPVATITGVSGVAVAPGSSYTLTPGAAAAQNVSMTVHVEGCVAPTAQVGALYHADGCGSSHTEMTNVADLTGSDDRTVTISNPFWYCGSAKSFLLHAVVHCGAYSAP